MRLRVERALRQRPVRSPFRLERAHLRAAGVSGALRLCESSSARASESSLLSARSYNAAPSVLRTQRMARRVNVFKAALGRALETKVSGCRERSCR